MQKLAILLLLACAACSTKASDPQAAAPGASAADSVAAPVSAESGSDTLAQIRARIGKAECTSDNQCQVLPIGARPCGGPASYLAWSNAKGDGAELQALAERHRNEQRAQNTRSGMISDCRAIAPPAAQCRAGSCQLASGLPAR